MYSSNIIESIYFIIYFIYTVFIKLDGQSTT